MEFLRFGSSIPGQYWGCCACDIIQDFKQDPDAKSSIQLVGGDGGGPITDASNQMLFAGPTFKDIFLQRIRYGTFGKNDMPNHAFIAILTDWQVTSAIGLKWLTILKETGFEFIRSVSNSVYTGQNLSEYTDDRGSKQNYIFMLVRNIGQMGDGDSLTPPKAWMDLPSVKPEAWQALFSDTMDVFDPKAVNAKGESVEGGGQVEISSVKALAMYQHSVDTAIWDRIGPPKFMTEKELVSAGVPVVMAGLRSKFPQQEKSIREAAQKASEAPKPQISLTGVKIA